MISGFCVLCGVVSICLLGFMVCWFGFAFVLIGFRIDWFVWVGDFRIFGCVFCMVLFSGVASLHVTWCRVRLGFPGYFGFCGFGII